MKFAQIADVPRKAALAAIGCYRMTRFFRAPSCRFYPSCSQYMAGCVQRFGLAKGSLLSMMRLVKCHPMHPGGVDEVPSEFRLSWSNETGQFESASIMRSTPERCP